LLLADEPTGNLDPATAARVMDVLVSQTRAQGASLVLVTHSEGAAAKADRVLVLTNSGLTCHPREGEDRGRSNAHDPGSSPG
jgi:putative ABC transport system ATP-binding protein